MKNFSAIIGFLACLISFHANAQQPYSYKKALADTLAKYSVPKSAGNRKTEEGQSLEKVEIEASVDAVAWRSNLEKNLQAPIEKAVRKGMKVGYYIVLVRFLVEKDGTMSDVKALNDPGYGLAQASVNVVKEGPIWTAGEVNGRKVRSYHTQPITFVISEK